MTWTLDKAHSKIDFSVRHMMISRVRGEFQEFDVETSFDPENIEATTVTANIAIDSIFTRQEGRDGHLKSADFFDAENYPTMTFKSSKVTDKGKQKFTLEGDLTIKETTKTVTLEGEVLGPVVNPLSGTRSVGFSLHGTINREDFGLNWNKAMETGGVLVGKEVTINIEAELTEDAG